MYQSVSINDSRASISKKDAIKQRGFCVTLAKGRGNAVGFTVTRLFPSITFQIVLFIIFACVGMASVSGGLYMRYYALPQIKAYLSYPTTNCTVQDSYTVPKPKGGTDYCIDVTYEDTNGDSQEDSGCGDQFRGFTNNSVFVCVLHGNDFLDSYSYIASQYNYAEDTMMWGYLIPLFSLVIIFTIIGFWFVSKLFGTKQYYASDILVSGCVDFVVTDWNDIGTELQQFFHVALVAYYEFCKESPPRETVFSKPRRSNTGLCNSFAAALSLFVACAPFIGLTIGASFLGFGYEFGNYIGSVVMYTIAFSFFMFFGKLIQIMTANTFESGTQEKKIRFYPLKSHTLSGTIY